MTIYMSVFYQNIFTVQTAKKFLSLQMSQASHALSDEFNNILKATKPSEKKRRRIVDEIFSSEQSYQEHVHLITSVCYDL